MKGAVPIPRMPGRDMDKKYPKGSGLEFGRFDLFCQPFPLSLPILIKSRQSAIFPIVVGLVLSGVQYQNPYRSPGKSMIVLVIGETQVIGQLPGKSPPYLMVPLYK